MRTLKLSVLFLSVLSLAASAQAIIQAPVETFTTSGIIRNIANREVQILVRTESFHPRDIFFTLPAATPQGIQAELRRRGVLPGLADFSVDENTEVLKGGNTSHDLSSLANGDEVAIRYRVSFDAKTFIVVKLTADVTTVRGVVQEAGSDTIEVEIGSTGVRSVRLSPHTAFGFTKTMAAGQEVNIVGWDFGDAIDAKRITVYNTDLPVQPPADPTR